jgi:RNA polymerase-binding transcription factor
MIAIGTIELRLPDVRAALEEQRRYRIAQLDEPAGKPATHASASSGAPDEVVHALKSGARFALAEIEAALSRMDAGRYGICQACDAAIPIERLEVLPMAALCLNCQQARDARRG